MSIDLTKIRLLNITWGEGCCFVLNLDFIFIFARYYFILYVTGYVLDISLIVVKECGNCISLLKDSVASQTSKRTTPFSIEEGLLHIPFRPGVSLFQKLLNDCLKG